MKKLTQTLAVLALSASSIGLAFGGSSSPHKISSFDSTNYSSRLTSDSVSVNNVYKRNQPWYNSGFSSFLNDRYFKNVILANDRIVLAVFSEPGVVGSYWGVYDCKTGRSEFSVSLQDIPGDWTTDRAMLFLNNNMDLLLKLGSASPSKIDKHTNMYSKRQGDDIIMANGSSWLIADDEYPQRVEFTFTEDGKIDINVTDLKVDDDAKGAWEDIDWYKSYEFNGAFSYDQASRLLTVEGAVFRIVGDRIFYVGKSLYRDYFKESNAQSKPVDQIKDLTTKYFKNSVRNNHPSNPKWDWNPDDMNDTKIDFVENRMGRDFFLCRESYFDSYHDIFDGHFESFFGQWTWLISVKDNGSDWKIEHRFEDYNVCEYAYPPDPAPQTPHVVSVLPIYEFDGSVAFVSTDCSDSTYAMIDVMSSAKERIFDKWIASNAFAQNVDVIDDDLYAFKNVDFSFRYVNQNDTTDRLSAIKITDGDFNGTDLTRQGTRYCQNGVAAFAMNFSLAYDTAASSLNPMKMALTDAKTSETATFNVYPTDSWRIRTTLKDSASYVKSLKNGIVNFSTPLTSVAPETMTGLADSYSAFPILNNKIDYDNKNSVVNIGNSYNSVNHNLSDDISHQWYVIDNTTILKTVYIVNLDDSSSLYGVSKSDDYWHTDDGSYMSLLLKKNGIDSSALTGSGFSYANDNKKKFETSKPVAAYQNIVDGVNAYLSSQSSPLVQQTLDFNWASGEVDFAHLKKALLNNVVKALPSSSSLSKMLNSDAGLYSAKQISVSIGEISFAENRVYYSYSLSWTPNGDKMYVADGSTYSLIDTGVETNGLASNVSSKEIDVSLSSSKLSEYDIKQAQNIANWKVNDATIRSVEIDSKANVARLFFDEIDPLKSYGIQINDSEIDSVPLKDVALSIKTTAIGTIKSIKPDDILSAINKINGTELAFDDVKISGITDTSATVSGIGKYAGSISISFALPKPKPIPPTPKPTPPPVNPHGSMTTFWTSQNDGIVGGVLGFLVLIGALIVLYAKKIKPKKMLRKGAAFAAEQERIAELEDMEENKNADNVD